MDIDKLLALKTLADEGTQIRAAEKLFCTQSALSKQIGTLERELDCRLFDRTGSRLVLNSSGQKVYDYAVLCLEGYAKLHEELLAAGKNSKKILCLGTTNSIGVYQLPAVLQAARAELPEMDVRFTVAFRSKIVSLLAAGKISLAILPRAEDKKLPAGCLAVPLFREEMALAVPAGHPLAGNSASLPDVCLLPFLVPESDSATRQFIGGLMKSRGMEAVKLLDFGNIEAIKQGILRGMGVSILPLSSIRRELASGELARCRIDGVALERTIDCVYRKNAPLTWWERTVLDLFSNQLSPD